MGEVERRKEKKTAQKVAVKSEMLGEAGLNEDECDHRASSAGLDLLFLPLPEPDRSSDFCFLFWLERTQCFPHRASNWQHISTRLAASKLFQ